MAFDCNQSCRFERCKTWQIVSTVFIGCLSISGLLMLFIIGGTMYAEERPKELSYALDLCYLEDADSREFSCSSRTGRRRCYAPAWRIVHQQPANMTTTIIGKSRFRYLAAVYERLKEYQVILSRYRKLNRFKTCRSDPPILVGMTQAIPFQFNGKNQILDWRSCYSSAVACY